MSVLTELLTLARKKGASDIHLEPGIPVTLRIRGKLQMQGNALSSKQMLAIGRNIVGQQNWASFAAKRSHDLSKTINGIRCRINVMQTSRGIGMSIRLLSSFHATIKQLNIHPELCALLEHPHGLIVVSGPTGSGKSTTISALLQEINLHEARHIITIEHPIEYALKPEKSLIRQREVGRDTPSFDQALLDAMREDPDVLVVGEMRDPETARLTLNAAETGHLVFSTLHSSTCAEALQRIVSAFPADIQSNVCGQLAGSLIAVICQRLVYREDLDLRIPECEVLVATTGVRSQIRQGQFSRLANMIETGKEHGMWSRHRYQRWLEQKTDWHIPQNQPVSQLTGTEFGPNLDDLLSPRPTEQRMKNVPQSSSYSNMTENSQAKDNLYENSIEFDNFDEDLEAIVSALKKL